MKFFHLNNNFFFLLNNTIRFFLLKYFFFFSYTVLAVSMSSLSLYLGTLGAAKYLHNDLLRRVLQAPLSFFDVTPLGRIINRFSHDVDEVDNDFPATLRAFSSCFFGVYILCFC